MSKLIRKYTNGNYTVHLFDDGTKIRMNDLDNLTPAFAESIDLEITNNCDGGCEYCYMNCTKQGKHGDLNNPVLDTLYYGTELAINGNDLSHPDLDNFLVRMKNKGIIVNMTINQKHLYKNIDRLKAWQDNQLIWGLGISLTDSSDDKLIESIHKLKNTVLHVIDGLFTEKDLNNLLNKDIALLILGYKHVGRGIEYYNSHKDIIETNINYLKDNIMKYKNGFKVIAFDNLSLEHLDIRKDVDEADWNLRYMGDEGSHTMFINLVNNKYAISSLETTQYDLLNSVDEMFNDVRRLHGFNLFTQDIN